MLSILAMSTALPGQEKALRAEQEKLVAASLIEPGCLRYELHQSLDDPSVLVFIEEWESEAHWRTHMEGEGIRNYRASGSSTLIQNFMMHRMELVAGK